MFFVLVGCYPKHDSSPPKGTLAEPIVVVSITDEIGRPISTACAIPDTDWFGPPYGADKSGRIRLTAIKGKDILVFAPNFENERIPSSLWSTNRFPAVTMKTKSGQNEIKPEPDLSGYRR